MHDVFHISGSLRDRRLFITGATGFIGKALVEKLLWSIPDVGRLTLLIRPDKDRTAEERLADEIRDSPIMARLRARHAEDWQSWFARKVDVVAGDLAQDRFGLDSTAYDVLCRRIDRVIASAATVTFDERLDLALELNTRGALRTLALARDAGNVPLVHVSTCFVSGRRTGSIPERLGDDLQPDVVLADLETTRRELSAEAKDATWVEAGTAAAGRHGFNDIYTLTKALGEHLVERERGAVPVAIVRPAIVESAAREPIPGWIETVRVADPMLVAYGRGRTRDIPGAADVPLEMVPVDHVVNALLAALASLAAWRTKNPSRPQERIDIYQLGSSRHPVTLGELMAHAREGFCQHAPLEDEDGAPIPVPAARFVDPESLCRKLEDQLHTVQKADELLKERTLEHFIRLIRVYHPYLQHGASYRDDATQALQQRLSPADREDFPFDIAAVDWSDYISRIHIPGLVRFALRAESGAPPPSRKLPPLEQRQKEAEKRASEAHSLFELFARVAKAHPDTMALQTFRDRRWLRYTYGQALTATANIAWFLAERYDIKHGDRVALWTSGSPEWVLTTLALHRLGAVAVPLDPQWPAAEIAQATHLVEAKLICAKPDLVAANPDLETRAGCRIVSLAAPFVPEPDVPLLPGAKAIDDARSERSASSENSVRSEDLATILFTSGTTVAPKAVPLTHANYLANVRDLVPLMRLSHERLLSVLPIHHVFEQMVGLLVPMTGASTISYVAKIEPTEISWMMNTTRPTVLVAVPRLLELLHGGILRSIAAGGPKLARLFKVLFALSRWTGARWGHRLFAKVHQRFGGSLRRIATGGSALEPSLGRSFQLMGFAVAEGYGMTETSPVMTVNPWNAIRFGSVGRPLPGVEFELREPAAELVGTGVAPGTGEIWVRGANVMHGYYRNPEASAEVLRDGWLNTGDLGFFDADGYLHISGRTKDVIVTAAGKNVYPEEVEVRYRDISDVEELIVLGLPPKAAQNGHSGEQVAAVVVPRSGASAEEIEGIHAAITERSASVPSYQQISRVEIWHGDVPKTTTLKVKRGRLRDVVLASDSDAGSAGVSPASDAGTAGVSPASGAGKASYSGQDSQPPSESETWVATTLAGLTKIRADQLGADDRLVDLGVDSLARVELVAAIEERLGRRLDAPTIASLSKIREIYELVDEV